MREWLKVKNEASAPSAEIFISGFIGESYWDDSSVSEAQFLAALNSVPAGRPVTIYINSEGGAVGDGFGIHSAIARRAQDVTAVITGRAMSIASYIPLAAGKVKTVRGSVWFIHKPWAAAVGNANDMEKAKKFLNAHEDAMVANYSASTGQTVEKIKADLEAETIMTGEEAVAYGLADEILDGEADLQPISAQSRFRLAPVALGGITPPPTRNNTKEHIMDKPTTAETPAPASTTSPPNADITALAATLAGVQSQLATERKRNIEARVNAAVTERRIPAAQASKWVTRAMADEAVLDDIAALPSNTPEAIQQIEIISDAPADICAGIEALRRAFDSFQRGNGISRDEMAVSAKAINRIYNANAGKLSHVMASNTISAKLQRTLILNSVLRAFTKKITPLSLFSTVFSDVALQGADTVSVPYYPLQTTTSTDWNASNGYDTESNTNDDAKLVTVNKRKYQMIKVTSSTLRRQPYFNLEQNALLAAEQLGVDVWLDVLSAITFSSFGAAVSTGLASAFDYDDLIDVRTACNQADWPEVGRGLILDATYTGNLLKDQFLAGANTSGGTQSLRDGVAMRLAGFDIVESVRIPTNSENLVGMAIMPSALCVATAPVEPAPGVRAKLLSYDLVMDARTGIGFSYRHGGDDVKDTDYHVIEAAYGYVAGTAAACKRIVSA